MPRAASHTRPHARPHLSARGPSPGPTPRLLSEPFAPRAWRATLDALLDLPIGVAGFTYVVALLALGLGTAVTILGLPVIAACVAGGRGWAAMERARARALLAEDAPPPAPLRVAPGFFGWIEAALTDRVGWCALLYLVLLLPLGILTFTVTVTLWALALGATTYPLWYHFLPSRGAQPCAGVYLDGSDEALLMAGLGVVLLFATPRLVHGLTAARRAMVRGLLRPGRGTAWPT